MFRQYSPVQITLATSIAILITAPVIAHNIEVSGDVAATFHLEPNHNPKAGQEATVWFALTKKGGELVPLDNCDCALSVYPKPHLQGTKPLLQPPLKAISPEKYQNIPGATLTFPQPGAYELVLEGKPKNGANFQPFNFSYTVNVGI